MSQKGEAFRRFAFLLTSSIMPQRGKTSALTIALLCLPVIVLDGRAFYLNQVQPVPLVVSKVINNSLSPNMAERNVQMILWLDYPAGKQPEWWGQPVQSQGDVTAYLHGDHTNRYVSKVFVMGCSYDQNKRRYCVIVHCVVPNYGRWKRGRTISSQVTLRQKEKERGVVNVEAPLPA